MGDFYKDKYMRMYTILIHETKSPFLIDNIDPLLEIVSELYTEDSHRLGELVKVKITSYVMKSKIKMMSKLRIKNLIASTMDPSTYTYKQTMDMVFNIERHN